MNRLPVQVAFGTQNGRQLALGALAAVVLHGGLLALALSAHPTARDLPTRVTEVDLMPEPLVPEPVLEEPAKEPEPEKEEAPAAVKPPPRSAPKRVESAPKEAPPSAAAPLHTAQEAAKVDGEPVRFAVDANGTAYGFGVVAQGGVASGQAGGTAKVTAPAPVVAAGSGSGNLRSFAVPPRIEESDPCRGYFPGNALSDRGEVTLRLLVSSRGEVQRADVLNESPASQGFGQAAVRCLRAKRFSPALDAEGRPQAAQAPVSVRFRR